LEWDFTEADIDKVFEEVDMYYPVVYAKEYYERVNTCIKVQEKKLLK